MLDPQGRFKIVDKVVNDGQLSLITDNGHVVGRVDDGRKALKCQLA